MTGDGGAGRLEPGVQARWPRRRRGLRRPGEGRATSRRLRPRLRQSPRAPWRRAGPAPQTMPSPRRGAGRRAAWRARDTKASGSDWDRPWASWALTHGVCRREVTPWEGGGATSSEH